VRYGPLLVVGNSKIMKFRWLLLVGCFLWSCNSRINLDGQWAFHEDGRGREITFENERYRDLQWNGDLVRESSGRVFVTSNPRRFPLTVSLIPDLQYSEGDTIVLPCTFLDIIAGSDSLLTVQLPTNWYGGPGLRPSENPVVTFRKVRGHAN